jgi:hypothetical protein
MGTSIRDKTLLERTTKFRSKRVSVNGNRSIINHDRGNAQNWLMEGSRLNCSGCRTRVKRMKVTQVM